MHHQAPLLQSRYADLVELRVRRVVGLIADLGCAGPGQEGG